MSARSATLQQRAKTFTLVLGPNLAFMSRDGQENTLKQVLKVCPVRKIMWSTAEHSHPETLLLAVEQFQEVLWNVLDEYLRKGDLNKEQAFQLVSGVLFDNANRPYSLGLKLKPLKEPADSDPKKF